MKQIPWSALACCGLAAFLSGSGRPDEIPFAKHTLDPGANETCALADVNGDGRADIISGENWFEAPRWLKHKFRSLYYSNNYIDAFSDLPFDVDCDCAVDVVTATWFGKKLSWYRNPGKGGGDWKEEMIQTGNNTEFALLVDIDNDGRAREVLPQFGNKDAPLAWYEYVGGKWERRVVSPTSYGHGIGAGDLNGDGRTDILTPKGWFQAPADPRKGDWTWRAEYSFDKALGFLHVHDVNGDGRRDIVTSHAHDYGLFWLEAGADGKFTLRMIDESWSQPHAVTLADLNGDGKLDLVTGKRYMAHNGRDPGEREPLGVYWYETLTPPGGKTVEWVRHVVDYGSRAGGGMQIPVADLDGDGDPDFAVAGKSGLFLFENRTKGKK